MAVGGLAIVLSGGGAKGAFQVGVLDELITKRRVKFDIFCGTSTGAIQALGGAQDDMPGLLRQWLDIRSNKDIYKNGPGLIGGALTGADSIYDASPVRAKLRAFADETKLKATGKRLLLGVVSLGTGQFRTINEDVKGIANWVYASCAMPLYFAPLVTKDTDGTEEQWVDGGVRNVTPLDDAMKERPRAVLVVNASPPPQVTPPGKTYDNLIEIGLRAVGITRYEVSDNDTDNAMLINDLIGAKGAQMRALAAEGITGPAALRVLAPLQAQLDKYSLSPILIMEPKTEVSDTLEFDPAKIRAGIEAGRKAVSDQWPELKKFLGV